MVRLAFLFVWIFPMALNAQHTITGTIRGYNAGTINLQSIFGERTKTIDSTNTDNAGTFRFSMKDRLPGVYRLWWGKERYLDLIWNREDVGFITTVNHPDDSLTFTSSVENNIFRSFTRLDKLNQSKLPLLVQIIDYYPEKDDFYRQCVAEFNQIQQRQLRMLDSLRQRYPESWAVRMASVYQGPYVSPEMNQEERMAHLKRSFFDKVDFNDSALLRSMTYPNKAISYMSLYSNNRLTQKQLEAEFIKAVNVILGAASVNPEVFRYLLDYLVSGFDKFHFEDVITYIADNFSDPGACEDQERKSALQKKLENFQKIAVGKLAPDLEVPDVKGKPVRLSSVDAEFTLLVFWSTNCPHCLSMMPRLKELYTGQNPKKFEVMSISIDTSRTAWTQYLREEKHNWINVSDLKGFYGIPAEEYNIYATPTLFLLDRNKKILAKPITLMELEQVLRDHKLIK